MLGMLGDPKKVASIIISKGPREDKEGNYEKEVGEVDKSDDDFGMIAEEMVSCMENKDREGLKSCFKSLMYSLESKINDENSESEHENRDQEEDSDY